MRLLALRHLLPAVIVLAGVIVVAFGGEHGLEGGMGIIGAGIAVWLFNWLWRVGVEGERERREEEAAREYFDAHGHWPDEAA